MFGTPIGLTEYCEKVSKERLAQEGELRQAIPKVPDLQHAWQLLLQCAGPGCHHFLRTVPPTQSRTYAEGHDQGMRGVMATMLGRLPGDAHQQEAHQQEVALQLATLPMGLEGFGLRSGTKTFPAAFFVGGRVPNDTGTFACSCHFSGSTARQ